jgi:D-xylose transport system permease protein
MTGAENPPVDPSLAAVAAQAEAEAEADLTAAAVEVAVPGVPAQTLGEYLRGWWVRVRGGDVGVLPVVLALVIVMIVFQVVSPSGRFLSPANLVNLFVQSSVFIVLAMAEGFVLLLGEIDLSVGYVGAIGGIIAGNMVQPGLDLPWWFAIACGLVVTALIGAIHGLIITKLSLPAFVVTLAGYLLWFGVMIILLGNGGSVPISSSILHNQAVLYGIVNSNIAPTAAWIGLALIVVGLGSVMWIQDARRRRSGLVAPPIGLTIAKIVLVAVAGIIVVAICNVNRGTFLVIQGVPYVLPIVLLVLGAWTILLERMQFGIHVYAVGGNAEAARRAGVSVPNVRTWGFILCSLTGGIGGIIYLSWQGGISTNIDGGQLVLYAVAAAVIGGTSLFGGRGRPIHGLLGGLVIGAIYNGLYLLGLPIQWQLIATGLVLLAAVTVDSLSRRGARTGVLTRG